MITNCSNFQKQKSHFIFSAFLGSLVSLPAVVFKYVDFSPISVLTIVI